MLSRRVTSSFCPSVVHFSNPLPKSQILGKTPRVVGGENNYIETLIETKKTPSVMSWMAQTCACSFHLFVLQSQRSDYVITVSSIWLPSYLFIPLTGLWKAYITRTLFSSENLYILKEEAALEKALKQTLTCVPIYRIILGIPNSVSTSWVWRHTIGNPHP